MLSSTFREILSGWVKASSQPFTDHPIANKLRVNLKNQIQDLVSNKVSTYIVKASAGAGNWANVPWLSMLDPDKTKSTQEGVYPVFLFRADGSGFYLSLGFGTTKLKENHGAAGAKEHAKYVASSIQKAAPEIINWGADVIDLRATTELGKSYEWASAGAKFYATDQIPGDDQIKKDLFSLINIYQKLPKKIIENPVKNLSNKEKITEILLTVRVPKPFILLAGISGTGKTRFVRKQASVHNVGSSNYCLVPVRPDWHEPSDLLGYVSRIGSNPKYVSTKVLQFIIDAWKAVAPSASQAGTGELDLTSPPYWLCLDEMNLAPVEQYFADYISVLESRKFSDGVYSCEALLDKSILNNDEYDIQADLQLSDNTKLWEFFCEFGIGIPPNLIVAGTVNMDETTHGFSRKVIDRALTIDFGEFYPNEYDKFFKGQAEPKILTYGIETRAKLETINCVADSDGARSIEFLEAVNNVLEGTPFQLAYRALNELLLFVNSFSPESQEKLQAVWDDFLMTKVLPRIDGDEDKLRITRDGEPTNLLKELEKTLEGQLDLIWSDDKRRLDLFRVDAKENEIIDISCRSKKKIKWMNERLDANTFTSYWP